MKINRLKTVIEKTALSRSGIYEQIAAGTFPKQIQLGPRCVGWIEQEVDDRLVQKANERNS